MNKHTLISSYYTNFRNSNLRQTLWPIRSYELFKFVPMAILMFSILLNQNVVRSLKDSLVMTLVGPEVINFIKLWGEMPLGILFVVIYTHLCNRMSTERAFRVIVIFFLSFYLLFGFVLYPYNQYFHPNPETITLLVLKFPHLKWFIIMWGKWSYVLIYIMGELWPIIIFSILFWQLANKITLTEEASRFYPFFSIFGQANCLIAGTVVIYFSSTSHFLIPLFDHISDKTEIMIKSLTMIILITGITTLIIHRYIENSVISKIKHAKVIRVEKTDQEKLKLGVVNSFKLIIRSNYLSYITIILIAYSFAMNLIEGIWMYKAREMYPDTSQFIAYQGKVLFWTGVMTISCALIGSTIIRKFGWLSAAILTPLVLLLTGAIFYIAILFQGSLENIKIFNGVYTPIMLIVLIGALQHVFSKGLKYSLFDATKEMAYIPLDDESKTKGKAAADILGAKIGKSIGSVIQILIFTVYPYISYNDIAGLLLFLFLFICITWLITVVKLANSYNQITKN